MDTSRRRIGRWTAGVMLVCLLQPATGWAAGFQFSQQSAKEQGSAYAGASASAADASAVWFNPAAMTRFERPTLTLGLHVMEPSVEHRNDGSTSALDGGTEYGPPGEKTNGGNTALAPNIFYVHPLNEDLALGIGVSVPFALGTEYDGDWVGRYHAVESTLRTVNINPGIGWRINDRISIGAGVSAMYANATLSSMVDGGAICGQIDPPDCDGNVSISDPEDDTQVRILGDSWAYGFNLGLLAEISEQTRLGLHIRSRVNHKITGNAKFDRSQAIEDEVGAALDGAGVFVDTTHMTRLSLPESVALSAVHELNQRWTLLADITWMGWSSLDEVVINYDSNQSNSVEEYAWQDVYRYSIGASWQQSSNWTWRAGISWDTTPVPDKERRSPRGPDNDRLWLTGGLSWGLGRNMEIDGALTYIHMDKARIENQNAQGHTLIGDFDNSIAIASIGLNWRF